MILDARNIRIEDYDYPLPDERIAKFPLAQRDSSQLLVYKNGAIGCHVFSDLPSQLPDDVMLVFNNTRVIQARMHFRKATGAVIEIFCLEPLAPADYALSLQSTHSCRWLCLIGNAKKWKEGALQLVFDHAGREVVMSATRGVQHGDGFEVDFSWNDDSITFGELLETLGELPIPPYLNRATEESDKTTYQTVYSKIEGSVAAPTAGLHFTPTVLDAVRAKGIPTHELTLHVGAGTFKPVKSDTIDMHEMHTEYISVSRALIEQLCYSPRRVVAVGTTSVRTLESLYYIALSLYRNPQASPEELRVEQWAPYADNPELSRAEAMQLLLDYLDRTGADRLVSATRIIIVPGYRFHIVDGIVTNFHQPRSTLLLLVSAFVAGDWQAIYNYALAHDFRFLSYGDSSLLWRVDR
ncbi:MAG: S-adenosylmethionine:tRNA ribosyltransferase-isomerase [Bacteroidaceae bacterium]|nr:S-adenosylmethionine:tRNA ribosyltransferase-isomerase [Bacteroidaceae bacterium]